MWFLRSCLWCLNGCVLWCARLAILAVLMLGVAVWAAHRAPVALPDMAVDGLAALLDRRAGRAGLSVGLQGADMALRGGLVPRLVLHGLVLRRADGTTVFALDRAEAVFSRRAAVQGRIAPVAITARGMTVTLERAADGAITLRLGDTALVDAAPDPATALIRLRAVLDNPALAGLRRVGLEDMTLALRDAVEGRVLAFSDGALRLDRTGTALRLDLSAGVGGDSADDRGDSGGGVIALRLDVAGAGTGAALVHGDGLPDALQAAGDPMARLRVALRGVEPARIAGLAGPTPLGAALSRVRAPVSLEMDGGLGPDGRALPLTGSLHVGAGLLDLPGDRGAMPIARARADLRLSPDRRHLELRDLLIEGQGVQLAGQADLRSPGNVASGGGITAQLALQDVAIDVPRAGRSPVALRADRVWADLRLSGPGGGPRGGIELAAVTVDRDGARATGRGRVEPGGRFALDLSAPQLDIPGALALWPVELAPRVRVWVAQTVSGGTIHDLRLSLRHDPANPRAPGRVDHSGLTFALRDGAMRINPRLPPLRAVSGQVVIDADRATLLLTRGRMDPDGGAGPVWFGPGAVWADTGPDATSPLRMVFDASGDVPAALALLQAPLFQPAGAEPDPPDGSGAVLLAPGAVTGQVAVTVDVALPLRRDGPPLPAGRRPDFTVTGGVLAVESDVLVPGRAVRADRLDLRADQLELRIAGRAQVGSIPVDMVYSRALLAQQATTPRPVPRGQTAPAPTRPTSAGRGRLVADLPLRPGDLAEAGLALPRGALRGEGRARVQVDFNAAGPPALSLDADLAGLAVSLPGMGLDKPASAPGRIMAEGRLGLDLSIDRATLDMPGAAVVLRLPDGWGGGVQFDRLALGGWLDAWGRFDPASARGPARLTLSGGTVDLRALPRRTGGARRHAVAINLALDRVTLADGIALTGLRGSLSPDLYGVLEARVNGAAPVRLRLAPGDGSPTDRGPALHLTADDGGAVLRAAGLASGVRAGALDLRLVPGSAPGRYRGQLRLAGLDLPAGGVTALRAGSVPDVESGAGGGLAFDDLRAAFTLDPTRIDIDSASATGSSLGLALDGRVDLRSRTLALQGVVSPLYFLNRLGAFMTRQGEGLIGLHFRLTGPMDAPELTANPLSVLTPGPLRDMFRARPPALPDQGTEDRE